MIQKVHSGQELTTGLVNGIIEQANGQQIPTTGQFTNTEKGTLYIQENNIAYDFQPDIKDKFLQCKVDYVPKLKKHSPEEWETDENNQPVYGQQILVNLGSNKEEALSLIKVNAKSVKDIVLIGNKEELDCLLNDSLLQATSGDKSKIVNDGYVNTTIEFNPDEPEKAIELYGEVYQVVKKDVPDPEYYYVISDGKKDYQDRIKNLIKDEDEDGSSGSTEVGEEEEDEITLVQKDKKRIMLCTKTITGDDNPDGINSYVQGVVGSQDIVTDDALGGGQRVYGDAEVSDIDFYEQSDEDEPVLRHWSIDRNSVVYEYEERDKEGNVKKDDDGKNISAEVTYDYFEFYKFGDTVNEECRTIDEFLEANDGCEANNPEGCGIKETFTFVTRVEKTDSEGCLSVMVEYLNIGDLSSKISTDTEITESDLMSGDEKLMRRKSIDRNTVTQTLEEVDENGANKTKEIDYLELYNFGCTVNANCRSLNDFIKKEDDEEGETSEEIKESFTFVARVEKEDNDGNVDAEIEYLNIGDLSNSFIELISGDSQMGEIGAFKYLRSIELCSMVDENGEETGEKYYQLYDFNNGCANLVLSAEELTHKDGFVFRKYDEEKNGFEIQYADPFSISNLVPLPDVDTTFFANRNPPTQKSIELKIGCTFDSNDNDGYYYQLYNVDKPSDMEETDYKVEIEYQGERNDGQGCYLYMKSLLPDQYEFVVRELGCGGCGIIHYLPLSVGVRMPHTDTDLGMDAKYPSHSIQVNTKAINPDGEFLQLYNFDDYGSAQQLYPNWDDTVNGYDLLLNRGDGILVRRINEDDPQNPFPTLEYMTLGSLSNFVNYIGDADNSLEDDCGVEKTYSIEKKRDETRHQDYMQLYQFDDPSNPHDWSINLDENGGSYYLTNDDQEYQFLVRSIKDGQPKLEYAKISIAAPVIDIPEIPDYSDWFYEYEERITVIEDRISVIEDILSGGGDSGCGCYWQQGGDETTNYGSSIGNSGGTSVIDLDSKTLLGCDWHVQNNMRVPDVLYTSFVSNIDSTVGGSINLTNKSLVGSTPDDPWTIFYMQGCELTCGTVYSNSVDTGYIGISQHNISIGGCAAAQIGAVSINGSTESPSIKIGSTVLTEEKLQQLLALVS